MKKDFYLVVSNRGAMRVVKNTPGLDWNEVAIKMNLEIPDEVFNRPQLSATVKIPDGIVKTKVVEAEIIDNIQEVIKQCEGVNINLTIVESKEDNNGN